MCYFQAPHLCHLPDVSPGGSSNCTQHNDDYCPLPHYAENTCKYWCHTTFIEHL